MMLNNDRPICCYDKGERKSLLCHLLPSLMALFVTILLCASSANAQLAGKGEIRGTVTDPSGAVVPGATVVATSTSRGIKFSTKSSATGDFSVSPLDPDIYTLTVSATGLSTTNQENIHVNALEVANVNISLRLDRKSTRLNSSHRSLSRMPSSA